MGLTIDSLKGKRASENGIAEITGRDRRTVKKYLEEEEIKSTPGPSGGKEYDFIEAIRALFRSAKSQNSADRRNDAQAHKLELEASILQKNHIPVGEVAAVVRAFLGAVNSEIKRSDMEDEGKERIAEKLKDCCGDLEQLTGDKIEE